MEEVLVAVFKAGELAFDFVETIHRKFRPDSDGEDE